MLDCPTRDSIIAKDNAAQIQRPPQPSQTANIARLYREMSSTSTSCCVSVTAQPAFSAASSGVIHRNSHLEPITGEEHSTTEPQSAESAASSLLAALESHFLRCSHRPCATLGGFAGSRATRPTDTLLDQADLAAEPTLLIVDQFLLLRKAVVALEADRSTARRDLLEARAQLVEERSAKEQAQSELEAMRAKAGEVGSSRSQRELDLEVHVRDLQDEMCEVLETMNTRFKDVQLQRDTLRREIAAEHELRKTLEGQLAALRREHSQLQRLHSEKMPRLVESQSSSVFKTPRRLEGDIRTFWDALRSPGGDVGASPLKASRTALLLRLGDFAEEKVAVVEELVTASAKYRPLQRSVIGKENRQLCEIPGP
ncbi:hypothetical protein WOLCODRAFT_152696 [Wolfiporia cocos MD-104 SS10]|uniref:Uncharacterized protein n=1 Tax=Wolfiporia cocos (strain MD-104) TaxID=742152 RepID=A0A2H3JUS4_WOLCO|nr:hypothetical protein WOLCODRAFT_152696 [Wolfiporia cocos MD-104 SS10]